MELRSLRAFVTVAEERHFRRAAERLHLAPASLTVLIQRLERQWGARLFERSSRTVELTDAGEALLPSARRVLDAARDLDLTARRIVGHSRLTVGTLYGYGAPFAERAAALLGGDGVPVSLDFPVFEWSDPTLGLADRTVDVAVIVGPTLIDADLVRVRLTEERRVAVLAAGHPLASRTEVTLAEIDEIGWVRVTNGDDAWHRYWRLDFVRGGAPVEVGPIMRSPNELILAIRNGRGMCTTLESYKDQFSFEGLVLVPVSDVPPCPVDLAYAREHETPLVRRFAEAALLASR